MATAVQAASRPAAQRSVSSSALLLFIWWVLGTLAGAVLPPVLSYAYWQPPEMYGLYGTAWVFVVNAAFGAMTGLITGLLQAIVLRTLNVSPLRWIMASTVGWSFVTLAQDFMIASAVASMPPDVTWTSLPMVVVRCLLALLAGAVIGLLQALALPAANRQAWVGWWTLATSAGWALGVFLNTISSWAVDLLSILSALNIATSESVTLLQIVLLALVTAAPPAFVTAATLVLLWRRYGGFTSDDTSHAVEARRTPVQHIPLAIGGSSPSRRPLAQVQLYGQAKALPPASIHANDNKVAGSALQPREGFAILLTFGAIVAALLLAARTLEPATETTSGFAVGPADSSLSSDGSMLRGDAGRTGVYPTKGVSEWPQIEWTFRSGSDWSQSPVAAGGIVLLPAGATVYAVDAKTGQEKWSHPYNGGTTSPSAIALGVAFFNSGCCLYAVDAYNGREKWKFDYGSGGSIDSPVVAGGVVYSNDSMGGRLHAIDATSGRELWALDTKGAIEGEIAVDESAAYFFRSPRMNDAILSGEDDLYAVDLQSGKVKWKYHIGAGANVAAPTVADGLVYIRSARGSSGDEYLVALDTATGREVWAYTLPRWGSGTTAVVAAQGMVYFGIDGNIVSDGSLVALDAKTGQEKWRNDRDPSVEWVDPVMAGGLLYISGFPSRADLDSMEARLHGIDAATGTEKWRVKIGGGSNRVPTLADDVIYLSDGVGNLYALR